MSKFIEVTTREGKIMINVDFVFKVERFKDKYDSKCAIGLIPNGYNNFPYQIVYVQESYEDIKALIAQ